MYHVQHLAIVPFLVLVAMAAESVEQRPLREALYEGDNFPCKIHFSYISAYHALISHRSTIVTFQVSIEVFQPELREKVKARTIDVPVTYETWGQITNDHGDLGDLRLFGCLDLSAPPFSDQVQGSVFVQSIRQNWIGTEAENGKDALFAMNRVIVLSDYIAGGEDGLGKCSFPSEDEKHASWIWVKLAPQMIRSISTVQVRSTHWYRCGVTTILTVDAVYQAFGISWEWLHLKVPKRVLIQPR